MSLKKIIRSLFIVACVLALMISCSDMDDAFEKYVGDEAAMYLHKVDSVTVRAGRNRVKFDVYPNIDNRVLSYRVYYNYGQDSVDVRVPKQGEEFYSFVIENLDEGVHSFNFVSQDEVRLKSLPKEFMASTYGDIYESQLSNRAIKSKLYEDNKLTLKWEDTINEYGIKITYTNVEGNTQVFEQFAPFSESVVENIDGNEVIQYQTIFRPEELACDLFFSDSIIIDL
ncbi:hypothetical protein EYV94_26685 [Puteibacter caeruleilacunae]|nr:hypothetical protein EYV94_26685 [Puteibacter caeruleilacunae]